MGDYFLETAASSALSGHAAHLIDRLFDLFNTGSNIIAKLVLPKAQSHPAEATKLMAFEAIAGGVPRDFFIPVLLGAFRSAVALGASMPKATVNENSRSLLLKREVRPAHYVLGVHLPPFYPATHKSGAEPTLCGLAAFALDGPHDSGAGFGIHRVGARLRLWIARRNGVNLSVKGFEF
jgi:hypothetical protein